jgi:hypothetical protein
LGYDRVDSNATWAELDIEGSDQVDESGLDGDRATGESYTIAHHIFTEDGVRKIMIASLRYYDTYAKVEGAWHFAERELILDWSETRPLDTPGGS